MAGMLLGCCWDAGGIDDEDDEDGDDGGDGRVVNKACRKLKGCGDGAIALRVVVVAVAAAVRSRSRSRQSCFVGDDAQP